MWKDKPIAIQLLLFTAIIFVSASVFSLIGMVLLIPLYQINPFENLAILGDFENNRTVLNAMKFLQVINAISIFIIPPLYFSFLLKNNPLNFFKLKFTENLYSYCCVALLIIVSGPLIAWIHELNQQMVLPVFLKDIEEWMKSSEAAAEKITRLFLEMNTTTDFAFTLFMMAVLPAIGEELLFRGVLQKLFHKWTNNIHWAIFITGFLFSAIHMQFYGFIPRMLLGVLFGYLFYWSNTLWIPILGHFVNNGFAVIMTYLYTTQIITFDIEQTEFPANMIISSAILVTILVYYFYKRHKQTINNVGIQSYGL